MKRIYNFIVFIFFYLFSFSISFGYFGFEKVNDGLKGDESIKIRDSIIEPITYILGFTALIGVIFVIYGGFKILTAGLDDEKAKSGKKVILYALLGIFIILIAYSLVSGIYNGLNKNV